MTLFQASDIPHRRILDMKTNDRTEKERRMNVENENGRVFQGTHQGCILDLQHIDGAIFFFFSSSSSSCLFSSQVQSRNIRITVDFFYVLLSR